MGVFCHLPWAPPVGHCQREDFEPELSFGMAHFRSSHTWYEVRHIAKLLITFSRQLSLGLSYVQNRVGKLSTVWGWKEGDGLSFNSCSLLRKPHFSRRTGWLRGLCSTEAGSPHNKSCQRVLLMLWLSVLGPAQGPLNHTQNSWAIYVKQQKRNQAYLLLTGRLCSSHTALKDPRDEEGELHTHRHLPFCPGLTFQNAVLKCKTSGIICAEGQLRSRQIK